MGLNSLIKLRLDSGNLLQRLKKITEGSQKVEKAVKRMNNKAANSVVKFNRMGKAAMTAAPKMRTLGKAVGAALGPLALVGGAIAVVTTGFKTLADQDFAEAKLKSLKVNVDALIPSLKGISDELQGQASVVELTQGAYDVASAGYIKAADAAAVLKASSMGATGGFSDLNTVANATTSVLNAYGLSAQQAESVVDKFIQTQNDGKIVVAEYANNIGKVASAAAGLNIPLEEVNTIIAQSTASGVNAEVAFTGLKGALARLASGQANKALSDVGVEITAASLASDGLIGTLRKIEESGADVGVIFKALGTESAPALLPVLNNLTKAEELLKNQVNSAGAAKDAQKLAANTINGAWTQIGTTLKNAFSDQSEFGDAFKETLLAINELLKFTIKLLTPILKFLGQMATKLFEITDRIGNFINAAKNFKVPGFNQAETQNFATPESKAAAKIEGATSTGLTGQTKEEGAKLTNKELLEEINKISGVDVENNEKKVKLQNDVNNALTTEKTNKEDINKITKKGNEDGANALTKQQEMWKSIKTTIADGLHGAIMGLIDGTKSLGESLAGIAKQIGSMMLQKGIMGAFKLNAEGGYERGGFQAFASGGVATRPTMGLVGEAGEDEYIIPASKMAQSMQRYSAGARGESVIPGTGQSSAGGGADAQTTVNYSGPILNFNSEEFVPKSAIGQIINSAASKGAAAGESRTMSTLRNSRGARARIGM